MDAASDRKPVDIVCVGFGPSGIAVAAALDEHSKDAQIPALSARFFEARHSSAWHPNFVLAGSDINHHFLRDLATPRDPRSRYTFVNYLKEKGRLYEFGQLGRSPSRQEWSDYVQWAAGQLGDYVSYDDAVEDVLPHYDRGNLAGLMVDTRSDRISTTNLVISVGAKPTIPEPFRRLLGNRVFHTSDYETRVAGLPRTIGRIVVVGAGQSAGEAIYDLRQRFPNTSIVGIQRSSGFKLYDLSQFSNGVYCPPETDYFYALPSDRKADALAETLRTNYSGLDTEICSALFRQIYEDSVINSQRIELYTRRTVIDAQLTERGIEIRANDVNTGASAVIPGDAVVLATGFRVNPLPDLLEKIRPLIELGENGQPVVGRDYSLTFAEPSRARIYLNGLCEHSHGIGDGQSFSMVALRAEAILKSILSRATAPDTRLRRTGNSNSLVSS